MLTQLQVINKILSSKDYSIVLNNNLTVDHFNNLKDEFNFIYNHYKQYNQVPDTESFLKVFPNFEIIEVNESIDYLVNELYREKNENFLVTKFNAIRDLLVKGETEKALDLFTSSANDASSNKQLEAVDILDDISRYEDYVDKCSNFSKYYVSTGFKELDTSLGGGIDRKNGYFVISARAGYGKTLVILKFAAEAASKGLRVGFYEGEMTVEKLGNRYDTITSHISNASINHGDTNINVTYKRYLDSLKRNHKGNLYILTRDMIGNNRMTVDILSAFVDKYKLDILFVDQISLLDDAHNAKQLFEQASNISKDLKALQVRKHIPIVVASQQNRSAVEEGKFAGTQNLSLSDRIGQDATEVMFITKEDNVMTFNIAKARDGCKQNVLSYVVDYNTCTFTYQPQEDDKLVDFSSYSQTFTPKQELMEEEDTPFGN